jgi:hypothetical protein
MWEIIGTIVLILLLLVYFGISTWELVSVAKSIELPVKSGNVCRQAFWDNRVDFSSYTYGTAS